MLKPVVYGEEMKEILVTTRLFKDSFAYHLPDASGSFNWDSVGGAIWKFGSGIDAKAGLEKLEVRILEAPEFRGRFVDWDVKEIREVVFEEMTREP